MFNKIGRLDTDMKKDIKQHLEEFYKLLDKNKKEQAEKQLFVLAKTPNYFIREFAGKELLNYHDQRKILPLIKKMLKHRIYGIRATAIFYFYSKLIDKPKKLLKILEESIDSVPWEVESIINDLWKKYPELLKESLKEWILSENESKRALSFHGMENIANSDPVYIMNFIALAIDDESMEVQKKITHILTQVARTNPVIVYPYIHEWLLDADEKRVKTIWVSMKKLANIVIQKSRREKSHDFVMLTKQTISDWATDENENVSKMGKKLSFIENR
ncbi:MAG: DNA alkylation repair protein [Candidatus Cloacimonetes bacterium]|nr:DNA alkylation repair protein [Candidatus Cloacimonadota bacterium]